MRISIIKPAQQRERGQTMALVALSMFTLIAMAALAIDLTTLYEARSEMQRAADAAALAGAKAFVDSSTTTDPGNSTLQTVATALASSYINQVLAQNKVGGITPTLKSAVENYTAHPGNPQITVTLERTDLPTFFARIFGRRLATVRATAIAEAYNSSGHTVPVATKCVKPWIIPNSNPQDGNGTFVTTSNGAVTNPDKVIGNQFKLCIAGSPGCTGGVNNLTYATAQVNLASGSLCPSCDTGANDYRQSVDCCNNQTYQCGDRVNIDPNDHSIDTLDGGECLIHASAAGTNNGQDTLDLTGFTNNTGPIAFRTGSNNLMSVPRNTEVNNSDSMVTILVATSTSLPTVTATVGGFMRAFVESVGSTGGGANSDIQVTFVNLAGCSSSSSGTAISGGGASPIPVRLIHN